VVEVRTAVEEDDRRAVADLSDVELRSSNGHESLTDGGPVATDAVHKRHVVHSRAETMVVASTALGELEASGASGGWAVRATQSTEGRMGRGEDLGSRVTSLLPSQAHQPGDDLNGE